MNSKKNFSDNINDDFYYHQVIVTNPKQTPIRIDKFLMDKLFKISRNRIQNAIKAGAVTVQEKKIKPNYKVRPNEEIRLVIPKPRYETGKLSAENIPLEVVYEDEDVMVINKKAGMVVHPGFGNHTGTLVNALTYYFGEQKLPLKEGNLLHRPGIVHRIDKNTSGLLLIAKTEFAMSHLAKQFFDHTVYRRYQAIVWGEPEMDEGTIHTKVGRNPKNRLQMTVYDEDMEGGKDAITHFKVIEKFYYISLVELRLETGRTHQIRVHMKHLGHPVFNDEKYAGDRIRKGTVFSKYKQFVENSFKAIPRHALHAKSIGFIHPTTNEEMRFDSVLPEDMTDTLERWRKYVDSRKELM